MQTSNERGGAEYANVDLLAALAARGHDVLLLTNLPDIADGTGVPARPIELGRKLNRASAISLLVRAPLLALRVWRALRVERPRVLFLHFKKEQLLCSLLPRRATGRVVWAEWGPLPREMTHGAGRLLYALASRRAAAVLAISEGTRRSVVAAGVPAEKVKVVPNLLDTASVVFDPGGRARLRAEWGARETTTVVGCISRFQRRKRNDVVIDAMASLGGDVLLVLAGEGEDEQALRARAEPHGERVRFAPNVRGHVEAFISACDVIVFAPSVTEGEPRSIVMAQLVGVPVVATAAEGAEGLIPEGGGTILSRPHDPVALAAALELYRDDVARREREGKLARETTTRTHDPELILRSVEAAMGV